MRTAWLNLVWRGHSCPRRFGLVRPLLVRLALNVARMYLMAQSYAGYLYWHDGDGKQNYAAAASAAAVLISVVGTNWAGRTR